MFVSTNQLVKSYGIDPVIARFFVDREPPANNLYWHEKLLYLRPAPGYLFIPLISDLLVKAGLCREDVLSDRFVNLMEQIGHASALEEMGKSTYKEAVQMCLQLAECGINNRWLNYVVAYFQGKEGNKFQSFATPFKALHRGDFFLFSLSAVSFPEALFDEVVNLWFALITTLLLLDDAEDIAADMETGDENAFIESGLNGTGLSRLRQLVENNLTVIEQYNSEMAGELKKKCLRRLAMDDILNLHNA